MKTIEINNVDVDIVDGRAIHTVSAAAMAEGPTDGPVDGQEIEVDGQRYTLGQHDYEDNGDGTITCTAPMYPA